MGCIGAVGRRDVAACKLCASPGGFVHQRRDQPGGRCICRVGCGCAERQLGGRQPTRPALGRWFRSIVKPREAPTPPGKRPTAQVGGLIGGPGPFVRGPLTRSLPSSWRGECHSRRAFNAASRTGSRSLKSVGPAFTGMSGVRPVPSNNSPLAVIAFQLGR